ncbi:MAG TPA: molybdate ABC transporter substrate-binding protein [Bryobacteraceae bacterium]|jgi:molybdate transport system substrate-binding protein
MWRTTLIAISCAIAVPAWPAELRIAAAADLAQVEPALGAAFTQNSGIKIVWVTGASGLLAKQAENGAPFDVFLSASENYVNEVISHDGAGVKETAVVYATGHVGLWRPPGSHAPAGSIHSLQDLLKPEVQHISIANPAHAPYGMAAKEALESQGLWPKIEAKLVYGENVRQALQFGESGNVDAVLTAWALVRAQPEAVELAPEGVYHPLRQAGAVLKNSQDQKAAREFMKFLLGPVAQGILRNDGFAAP